MPFIPKQVELQNIKGFLSARERQPRASNDRFFFLVAVIKHNDYHTRAIITRGLYIFNLIFHCGLYSREVGVTDSLCTKKR